MKKERRLVLVLLIVTLGHSCLAQEKLLKKSSWINTSIEEFSRTPVAPDTSYLRYTFENELVLYGLEPGWHDLQMPYAVRGKSLKLGFDQWAIETLTDSTLTIFLRGFRRMKFVAEEYLQSDEHLVQIGEYDGKPLYKANRFITPRYKKTNPLREDILKQDRTDDYNIRKAGIFLMSFIVTENGKVENPIILKSVVRGFDDGVIKELLKTSGQWRPATFKGQRIQSQVIFEVRFLDSLQKY